MLLQNDRLIYEKGSAEVVDKVKKLDRPLLGKFHNESATVTTNYSKMGRLGRKLRTVLWKSLILRKRHYILTALVLLIPIVLFVIVGYAGSKLMTQSTFVNSSHYNDIVSEEEVYQMYKMNVEDTYLLYTPSSNFTSQLMREVQLKFGLLSHAVKGFDTEDHLLAYFQKLSTDKTTLAVIFNGLDGDKIPDNLNYNIRYFNSRVDWSVDELFHTYTNMYIPGLGSETYFHTGFLSLQMALDSFYLKLRQPNHMQIELATQEFPYPPHMDQTGLNEMFIHLLPFITLFSFMLICPATMKRIVEEKDSGIKELMKMMGLPPSIMWLCWFIDAIVANMISIVFIVICLKSCWGDNGFYPIEYTDAVILALFFILYCSACIATCFVISTFFDSPNITTVCGIIFWIISYLIPYSMSSTLVKLNLLPKVLLCIFPNIAMYFGYSALATYETRGSGVHWSNLFTPGSGGTNEVSMGLVLLMLLCSTILFLLLTFYLDSVRPGKYGMPKAWSFPLDVFKKKKIKETFSFMSGQGSIQPTAIVPMDHCYSKIEACGSHPSVQIENLSKRYGAFTALNNLSIDFYDGEITALLGHNGAGKTTTMSILTGMTNATGGNVTIGEFDLKQNIDKIRTMIGICPQHDLLFPDLTVREHLLFFAKLNNIENPDEKVKRLLCQLNIEAQKNICPDKLSGGMKRKLCLGMALISDPQLLILDEPTSGLDPKSRREIWDILLKWRRNDTSCTRTVLISTHFMEEAEVLGDRIAIMDHGNLIAYGTPMFLKKEYCTGYILTISKTEESDADMIESCVKNIIPRATLKDRVNDMVTYSLPNEDKCKFPEMLNALEKTELGVKNFVISITTLEDVFLRVSKMLHDEPDNASVASETNTELFAYDITQSSMGRTESKLKCKRKIYSNDDWFLFKALQDRLRQFCWSGCILFRNHFSIAKKLWKMYAIYFTFFTLSIILTLVLSAPTSNFSSPVSSFKMDLSNYGDTIVYYSTNSKDEKVTNLMDTFAGIVRNERGYPIFVPSVSEALLDLGIKNIEEYKQHAIIAAEFNTTDDGITINFMYSNVAIHGTPISLNLITSALAKAFYGGSISVTNEPLVSSMVAEAYRELSSIEVVVLWMLLFPLGLLFLVGSFIVFPYKERKSNIKHLLYMTGIKSCCYWFCMFVFDLIYYILATGLLTLFIMIYPNPIFNGCQEVGAIFLLFLFYGIVCIPFVYLFSYKSTVASAFGSLIMTNLFTGVVFTIVVSVLGLADGAEKKWGDFLHVVCHLSPQYWLVNNLMTFSRKAVWNYNWDNMDSEVKLQKCNMNPNPCCPINGIVNELECNNYKTYYTEGLAAANILLFLIVFVIYSALLMFLDTVLFKKLTEQTLRLKFPKIQSKKNLANNIKFSVNELGKSFGKKDAVKNISFEVKDGCCFGLLGINGAGKTTTFKMLTGQNMPDSGTATIQRANKSTLDLSGEHDNYLKEIGYCPQFNAIYEILTGRELLTLFAELRGIPTHKIGACVNNWIKMLGLGGYEDVMCGKYSGGNKRKLCVGISLIANPSIIMLDEPTSGVDPVSRRNLWEVLKAVKSFKRQSIILTSHSMDECEVLCDNLGIMIAGSMKCTDTIPSLKVKYGQGFTILIKVKQPGCSGDDVDSHSNALQGESNVDFVEREFTKAFSGYDPEFKDRHLSLLHVYMPNRLKPSELFKKMEEFKTKNSTVEDYSINMATLEDIFLTISRNTLDDENCV